MVFVSWHSVPAKVLLEKQGRVLIDLFCHLSLVMNRRDAETVKLDELLQESSGHKQWTMKTKEGYLVVLSELVPPLDLPTGQAGVSLS